MTSETDPIRKVAFVSLGCPKNLVDSEAMLGMLRADGLRLVNEDDEPDALVVNTCGFLEASKRESLDVIEDALQRKRDGDLRRVVVAGCLVQRHRARLLEWAPEIDAMIGVFDRDHIVDAVRGRAVDGPGDEPAPRYWIAGNALQAARARGRQTVGLTVQGGDGRGVGYYEHDGDRFRLTPRHWAYLRVSEGCNQKCAFCTIPSIRGKMRSKPIDEIRAEARALMADGAFELNLIGQDTTSFGSDIGYDGPDAGLVGLLRTLDGVASEFGGGWMRLMYAYPTNFTDEMIEAMATLANIVKYIDIPLQHASDRMLTLMRRGLTSVQQRDLLERLRERIPGVAIRTTFITGFPGETEDDHEQLLELVESFGFDMLGVFRFSPEDGTPAGTLDRDPALRVDEPTKARREAEIMLAQQQLAFENAEYVAEQRCEFDVLIDGPAPATAVADDGGTTAGHAYVGRCYHQAPQVDSVTCVRSSEPLAPGELVRCTIVAADGYDLVARPTEQLERRTTLPVVQ